MQANPKQMLEFAAENDIERELATLLPRASIRSESLPDPRGYNYRENHALPTLLITLAR